MSWNPNLAAALQSESVPSIDDAIREIVRQEIRAHRDVAAMEREAVRQVLTERTAALRMFVDRCPDDGSVIFDCKVAARKALGDE